MLVNLQHRPDKFNQAWQSRVAHKIFRDSDVDANGVFDKGVLHPVDYEFAIDFSIDFCGHYQTIS